MLILETHMMWFRLKAVFSGKLLNTVLPIWSQMARMKPADFCRLDQN